MTRRSFAAALAAAPFVHAQSRAVNGRQVVDQVIAALGGQNFLAMRDRVETGRAYTFYNEELTGLTRAKIYTQYVDNPAPGVLGIRERQTYGKKEESAVLFFEGQGFEVTFRGARPLPDLQLERYRLSTFHNFFYILRQRLKEPGMTFELAGHDVVENQPVDILDIFDNDNERVTVYVNSTTKLPVRQRWYRRDPITHNRLEEVTRYSKYRDAGHGVMWPMDLQRERDTEKLTEIYDESVAVNNGLSPSLFQLPRDIKILEKPKS